MDARPKDPGKWIVHEELPRRRVPRRAKQIVIPMTQQQYDEILT